MTNNQIQIEINFRIMSFIELMGNKAEIFIHNNIEIIKHKKISLIPRWIIFGAIRSAYYNDVSLSTEKKDFSDWVLTLEDLLLALISYIPALSINVRKWFETDFPKLPPIKTDEVMDFFIETLPIFIIEDSIKLPTEELHKIQK